MKRLIGILAIAMMLTVMGCPTLSNQQPEDIPVVDICKEVKLEAELLKLKCEKQIGQCMQLNNLAGIVVKEILDLNMGEKQKEQIKEIIKKYALEVKQGGSQ